MTVSSTEPPGGFPLVRRYVSAELDWRFIMVKRSPFLWIAGAAASMLLVGGCLSQLLPTVTSPGGAPASFPPGVKTAHPGFSRKLLATTTTETISSVLIDPASGNIAAGGSEGVGVWSSTGAVRSSYSLPGRDERVQLVPKSGANGYGCLFRGSWASPSRLFDPAGKQYWAVPYGQGVDDAIAANFLPQAARPQVVVGYNGGGGISMFDAAGKLLWNKSDGNVWHVEALHVAGTPELCIVHSNAGGEITVRNPRGAQISKVSPGFYFSWFTAVPWPNRNSNEMLLANPSGKFLLVDTNGNIKLTLAAPHSPGLDELHACLIRIKGQPGLCLAVVAAPANVGKGSTLSLYSNSGTLIFEEVLPEMCRSVAALTRTKNQPETLIVGGTNHLWRY